MHSTVDMADLRVFISYSHDSDAHREAVLQLAQQLRRTGIDVQLDRFVPDPDEGWPRWMMAQVDTADLVILACTATYRRRFEGQEEPGKGKGVTFEGLLAIQHLYDAGTRNRKFVPIVFDGATEDDVPLVLRPYTRYALPGQFDQLYRRLTGQPEVVAEPLGPRKIMPPRGAPPAATDPSPAVSHAHAPVEPRSPLALAPIRSAGSRDVAVTPIDALHRLLISLFVSGEVFRQWVGRGPDGPQLVAEIPSGTASATVMVSDGIDILTRRGYLDDDFFTRLVAEFGRRKNDIDRVAMAWRTAPATSASSTTHGGFHFGAVSGNVQIHAGRDIIAGDKHVTILDGQPSASEARGALETLRTALAGRGGDEQRKIDRALDDAADELSPASPDRPEVAQALARALKVVARVSPGFSASPAVASPLATLRAWLGPDGDLLRPT